MWQGYVDSQVAVVAVAALFAPVLKNCVAAAGTEEDTVFCDLQEEMQWVSGRA